MSDHYYSSKPQSEKITETHEITIRNHKYTFRTSSGVFSKHGIDYGSRVLIDLFKMPQLTGRILDLGCGYGPVGLVLARENPDYTVEMVDINERALDLAQANAKQNKIQNIIVSQSDGLDQVAGEDFAVIITNPPIRAGKEKIYQMFKDSYHKLKQDGELWLVIQKKQGAPSAKRYLASFFDAVTVVGKDKGYYVFKAKK